MISDREHVASMLGSTTREAKDEITSLAIGTIRRQMIGLLLIGAGTVRSAIPAIWCA